MPQNANLAIDIQTRLQQWIEEISNPNHANHYHAELNWPADRYPKIIQLIERLRSAPDDFDKHDVMTLFGLLNSGQRTKDRLVQHNELTELRRSLLRLLDQNGDAAQKIARAADEIRYAGSRMVGELYGWAFAETQPLYNQCAIDALHYLGYEFNAKDYDAFVEAHERFKAVYAATIGQQRPEIPLNLEVDKFYNVIHKVDLKQRSVEPGQPMQALFSNWVRSLDEAEWALNLLRETLDLLGAKGPDDERIALTVRHGATVLRLNFGNLWLWDLCGPKSYQGRNGLSFRVDSNLTELAQQYESSGGEFPMVYLPFDEAKDAYHSHLDAYKSAYTHFGKVFEHWRRSPYRKYHKDEICRAVYDPSRRLDLYQNGLGNGLSPEPEPHKNPVFKPEAFRLFSDLHLNPSKAFYDQHKQEFQSYVEDPFKALLLSVADRLPDAITDLMETRKRIVARITKNDFGQGGAWEFYWGAFYPKGSKRSEDAQLSVWMDRQFFECGFYIGDYGSEQRERFQRNCEQHVEMLAPIMEQRVTDELLFFGPRESLIIGPDGMVEQAPDDMATWHDFLENPTAFTCDVSVIIPRQELLQLSKEELATRIAAVHTALFPLVLLACHEDPIPAIENYLGLAPTDDGDDLPVAFPTQPDYSLAELIVETGLEQPLLERWVRAVKRKQQAIFYGPPGTGKTFVAERLARHLVGGGDGFIDLVQFHPAYAYEDFIQGIRPDVQSGQLSYDLVPGRFLDFCYRAAERSGNCVLIIDEINRANLARVFGELMYLLEYRDREIPLAGGGVLRIPHNLYLLGTMNTADRSIALVDHALRRRFAFLALYPDFNLLRRYHTRRQTGFALDGLIATLEQLNLTIQDRHYHVGISFFMRTDLAEQIEDIWRMEIEPYLEEYFFDQPDNATRFTWDKIRSRVEP